MNEVDLRKYIDRITEAVVILTNVSSTKIIKRESVDYRTPVRD